MIQNFFKTVLEIRETLKIFKLKISLYTKTPNQCFEEKMFLKKFVSNVTFSLAAWPRQAEETEDYGYTAVKDLNVSNKRWEFCFIKMVQLAEQKNPLAR